MKTITKLFWLIVLTGAPLLLSAQTEVSSVNGIYWRLVPTWHNAGVLDVSCSYSSGSPFCEGVSTGILKIDDNSIISAIQIDSKQYGVVRLNKDLTSKWLTNIDGFPIATGIFNGNILVVTATEYSAFNNISNVYTGFVIDPKTGKVITRKELFNGGDKVYTQPVFLIAPDGSSFKIAVRTSDFTKGVHSPLLMFKMNKVAEQYFTTTDFQLLEFTGTLDVKSTIKPVLESGYFLGGTTNKNGDVFLMTEYSQGFIKIAKYENGKTTPAKVLQLSVNINDDIIANLKNMYLFTSKTDPQTLFFAASYFNGNKDRELDVAKFNFKNGVVTNNSQIMDKPYLKELAKSYVPFSKKFDNADLGLKDEMRIRNIAENEGKLIVALSSYAVYNNANTGHSSVSAFDLLINIYDDKSNLQFQQIIPRSYSSMSIVRMGVGMHCNNNVLYVTANNNKGFIGYKALYGQVDLKTGSITNITGIEKNNIKRTYAIDPYGSFWFDNQFVLSYMEEKGLFDSSEDAHMQLLNY